MHVADKHQRASSIGKELVIRVCDKNVQERGILAHNVDGAQSPHFTLIVGLAVDEVFLSIFVERSVVAMTRDSLRVKSEDYIDVGEVRRGKLRDGIRRPGETHLILHAWIVKDNDICRRNTKLCSRGAQFCLTSLPKVVSVPGRETEDAEVDIGQCRVAAVYFGCEFVESVQGRTKEHRLIVGMSNDKSDTLVSEVGRENTGVGWAEDLAGENPIDSD